MYLIKLVISKMNKKEFIVNNIIKINHTKIIDLIKLNHCYFTENQNGIFINLNIINNSIIDEIYNIIYYDINNNLNHNTIIDNINNIDDLKDINYDTSNDIKNKFIKKKIKNISKMNHLLMNDFSPMDQSIIKYTKKYYL